MKLRYLFYLGIVSIVSGLLMMYSEELVSLYYDTVRHYGNNNTELIKNQYYRGSDFLYVQNTVDYEPNNVQDIYNLFYTIINSGQDTFTFYCSRKYENCLNDVKTLASDQTRLSHINNYVHPFNSFKNIEIEYATNGQVDVTVYKSYDLYEIEVINAKVDEIYNNIVNPNISTKENIKLFHDYIINHSKYDSARSDYNILTYKSDTAYGPLLQGYGICGGYSDAMLLFLEKLGVVNYKVASDTHIWNAVLLDGKWYHLDLTWDDPITSNNVDILLHDYFLVSTQLLFDKDNKDHKFDNNIYIEFQTY